MKEQYPEMFKVCENFTECVERNVKKLIERLNKGFETIIKPGFLSDLNDVRLKRIIPTGSDFHNGANQVLILEFSGINQGTGQEESVKVVYKPSSVAPDAVLFGDIGRLRAVYSNAAGSELLENNLLNTALGNHDNFISFSEILNQGLDKKHAGSALPTYLVVPMTDGSDEEMKNHYGYVEYLEHHPSQSFDYEDIINEALEQYDLNQEKLTEKIQARVDFEQTRFLTNHLGHKSDFIIYEKKSKVEEQHSIRCGLYIMLAIATGFTDANPENAIVSNKIFHFIDGEVSLSQLDLNEIDNLLSPVALYAGSPAGAMLGNSYTQNDHTTKRYLRHKKLQFESYK
jgi:hypothetical protein